MKNVSLVSTGTLVLALLVFGLFPAGQACCQEGGIALLLQQTPSQGGTVSPDVGVHRYDAHEKVTLVAVPKPGYNFVYWLGDVLDPTSNKTTALLDEPKVIIAVFQQVDDGQLVVGQTAARRRPAGGGGASSFSSSSSSPSGGGPVGGGGAPPGDNPDPPTEGDPPPDYPPDDPPNDPPDDPYTPPDDPFDPPDDPFDPPDDPYDPPDDPPDDPFDPPEVPEPATGLLLTLGGLALLRKRRQSQA